MLLLLPIYRIGRAEEGDPTTRSGVGHAAPGRVTIPLARQQLNYLGEMEMGGSAVVGMRMENPSAPIHLPIRRFPRRRVVEKCSRKRR